MNDNCEGVACDEDPFLNEDGTVNVDLYVFKFFEADNQEKILESISEYVDSAKIFGDRVSTQLEEYLTNTNDQVQVAFNKKHCQFLSAYFIKYPGKSNNFGENLPKFLKNNEEKFMHQPSKESGDKKNEELEQIQKFILPFFGISVNNFFAYLYPSNPQFTRKPFFESYYKKSEDHSFSWKSFGYDLASCIVPVLFLPLVVSAAILSAIYSILKEIVKNLIGIITNLVKARFIDAGVSLLKMILFPPLIVIAIAIALPLWTAVAALMEIGVVFAQFGNIVNMAGGLSNSLLNYFESSDSKAPPAPTKV